MQRLVAVPTGDAQCRLNRALCSWKAPLASRLFKRSFLFRGRKENQWCLPPRKPSEMKDNSVQVGFQRQSCPGNLLKSLPGSIVGSNDKKTNHRTSVQVVLDIWVTAAKACGWISKDFKDKTPRMDSLQPPTTATSKGCTHLPRQGAGHF